VYSFVISIRLSPKRKSNVCSLELCFCRIITLVFFKLIFINHLLLHLLRESKQLWRPDFDLDSMTRSTAYSIVLSLVPFCKISGSGFTFSNRLGSSFIYRLKRRGLKNNLGVHLDCKKRRVFYDPILSLHTEY
jgi:hypothetical protein